MCLPLAEKDFHAISSSATFSVHSSKASMSFHYVLHLPWRVNFKLKELKTQHLTWTHQDNITRLQVVDTTKSKLVPQQCVIFDKISLFLLNWKCKQPLFKNAQSLCCKCCSNNGLSTKLGHWLRQWHFLSDSQLHCEIYILA